MAAETVIESFCERCGTRYTFEPVRKRESRLVGLGKQLGILLEDHAAGLAQRDPFHGTFHFCLECRQYTCPRCWNETAGFCLGCMPLPGREDAVALAEAESEAGLEAATWMDQATEQHAALADPSAWPDADLHRGHEAPVEPAWPAVELAVVAETHTEPLADPEDAWSLTFEPEAVAEPEPELVADAEAIHELELEPDVLAEAEAVAELEAVAEPDDAEAELDLARLAAVTGLAILPELFDDTPAPAHHGPEWDADAPVDPADIIVLGAGTVIAGTGAQDEDAAADADPAADADAATDADETISAADAGLADADADETPTEAAAEDAPVELEAEAVVPEAEPVETISAAETDDAVAEMPADAADVTWFAETPGSIETADLADTDALVIDTDAIVAEAEAIDAPIEDADALVEETAVDEPANAEALEFADLDAVAVAAIVAETADLEDAGAADAFVAEADTDAPLALAMPDPAPALAVADAVVIAAVVDEDDAGWEDLFRRLPEPSEDEPAADDWAALSPWLGPDIAPTPATPTPAPEPVVAPAPASAPVAPTQPAVAWQLTAPTPEPEARPAQWPPLGPVFRPQPAAPTPAPHPSVLARRPTSGGLLARGQATPAAAQAMPNGVRPCVNCELPLSSTARFCRRCGRPQA